MIEKRQQAKLLIVNGSNLLIVRRSSDADRRALEWEIPGGGVERDETPTAAAVRETKEETGISIAESELTLVAKRSADFKDRVVTWYFYRVDTDQTTIILSDEHVAFDWVSSSTAVEKIPYELQQSVIAQAVAAGILPE